MGKMMWEAGWFEQELSPGYTYAQHLLGGGSLISEGLEQGERVGGGLVGADDLGEGLHPRLKLALVHHCAENRLVGA